MNNRAITFSILLSVLTLPHCGPRGVEGSSRVKALFTLPMQQSPAGEIFYADESEVHWVRCAGKDLSADPSLSVPAYLGLRCKPAAKSSLSWEVFAGRLANQAELYALTSSDEALSKGLDLVRRVLQKEGTVLVGGLTEAIQAGVAQKVISQDLADALIKSIQAGLTPLFNAPMWKHGCPRETRLTQTTSQGCFIPSQGLSLWFAGERTTDFLAARQTCAVKGEMKGLPSRKTFSALASEPTIVTALTNDELDFHWLDDTSLYVLATDMVVETVPKRGGLIVCEAAPWENRLVSRVYHSCALDRKGQVRCWGSNAENQLQNIPAGVFTTLAAGKFHTCGLTKERQVNCWGDNRDQQLTNIPAGSFTQLTAGDFHTCGLTKEGQVKCWGNNTHEQLSNIPAGSFTQLTAGSAHTCGLTDEGQVKCWGDNRYQQLTNIPSGSFTRLAVGFLHTCGLTNAGQVRCWGDNRYQQLTNIPSGSFTQLTAGGEHTCGLTNEGQVKCWGDNSYHQLSNIPTSSFIQLTARNVHTCVLTNEGQVKCWGDNRHQQLENIPSGPFTMLAAGRSHTCGLTKEGQVKCWGNNYYGQLNNVPAQAL